MVGNEKRKLPISQSRFTLEVLVFFLKIQFQFQFAPSSQMSVHAQPLLRVLSNIPTPTVRIPVTHSETWLKKK